MNTPPPPTQIDCDEALLLGAAAGERTLTAVERQALDAHFESCAACREIEDDPGHDEDWISIARMPLHKIERRSTSGRVHPPTGTLTDVGLGERACVDEAVAPTLASARIESEPADGDFGGLPVVEPSLYAWGETLGRGGMGRVVLARDRRLGRAVAVKELLHDGLEERFEKEARITARLQHPAIVNVYEAGCWPSGDPFYTMKLVEGEPLSAKLRARERIAERIELLPNLMAVVDAIAYAHSEGVIHRDIKPSNIVIGPFGETVVIDWGLAKDLSDVGAEPGSPFRTSADGATQAGVGTPQYMPPEQARGQTPDERVDVYALGATLYHLLDGEPPYRYGTAKELLASLEDGPPPPIRERQPEVPAELAAIVDKALARDPADRYPDAGSLAEDLRRFQAGQLVGAVDYSSWALVKHWLGRHRALVTSAVAILALATAGATVSVLEILDERRAAEEAKERAMQQTAAVLAQRGRAELAEGRALQATPYLAEAYKLAPSPVIRYMLGEAMRAVDAQVARIEMDAPVDAVALAPHGDRVAIATGEVVEVRGTDGAVQTRLAGHEGRVTSIAWSDDGKTITTTGEDSTARRWAADGRLVDVYHRHGNIVRHAVAMADGSIASIGDDATVRRWKSGEDASPPTFRAVERIVGWDHEGALVLTKTTVDGKAAFALVATRGADAGVRQSVDAPEHLDFARLGPGVMALVEGAELQLWTTSPPQRRAQISAHAAAITGVAFTRDGQRMLSADEAGELLLWDVPHAALLGRVAAHRAAIASVSVSADGQRIATGGRDGRVRIWAASALAFARVIGSAKGLRGGGMASGTRGVVVPDDSGGLLLVSGDRVDKLPCRGVDCAERLTPIRTVLSEDGTRAAVCDSEYVYVWDLERGVEIGRRKGLALTAAFSPDGTRVVSGDGENAVIWEVASGAVVATLRGHTDIITAVAFAFFGRRVGTASRDGSLRIWDAADGAQVAMCEGHTGPIEHLLQMKWLFETAGADGVVRACSVNGVRLRDYSAHTAPIVHLQWLPSIYATATTGEDGWTRLWRADHGLVFEIESGPVRDLAWHDAGLLAIARADNALEIWNHRLSRALVRLESPQPIDAVRFTEDGRRLVYVTRDGLVFSREVPSEEREPAEITRRLEALGSWLFGQGFASPVSPASVDSRRRLAGSAVKRRFDFAGDSIQGHRERPGLAPREGTPAAGSYRAAWEAFDRAEYDAAHTMLMRATEVWSAPIPQQVAKEHALFASRAGAPIAGVIEHATARSKPRSALRAYWLDEVAREYSVVGRTADALAASDALLAEVSGAAAFEARVYRARLANTVGDPEQAIEEALAATRELPAGSDRTAADSLAQFAELYHSVYSKTFDARYGRAALAAYAALAGLVSGPEADALAESRRELETTLAAPPRGGTLTKRILRRGMRAGMFQIFECYNRVLQTEPDTRGTLVVEVFINNSGVVLDTTLTPSPGKHGLAAVSACVDRTIRGWVFPRPRYSPGTYVRYPLLLRPPE